MAKSGRPCLSSPGAETLDGTSGVQTGGELTPRHLPSNAPVRLEAGTLGSPQTNERRSLTCGLSVPAVQAGRH